MSPSQSQQTTSAYLCVDVRDDGAGGASFAGGLGPLGLKDRVQALGGRMSLGANPATARRSRSGDRRFDDANAIPY